jgi:hypothetical protein
LAGVEVLEVSETPLLTAGVAELPYRASTVSAADLGAALADEVGRLEEEGHRLQVLASRMAQDARREFEAWFEAGLLLRRASERLAEIARSIA